ncbi:MAG: hypothetical protein JWQ74_1440 [Marmoricola sp.]|nr:hypothetical protein [Marmoricola sp.]
MDHDSSPDLTAPPRRAPVPLLVAAALVVLEGIGAVGFGIAEAVHTDTERIAVGATTTLFFLAYGVGMIVCARGLTRLGSWARGPVLIVQLISLGLAWNFREGETWPAAVALAVPAVAVLVGMLHPATIAALNEPDAG